jgi:hypothetical protein
VIALADVLLVVMAIAILTTHDLPAIGKVAMVLISLMFSIQFVTAEMDSYSRFQNYKQLKDQLYFNGFQKRILRPMVKSRCQRDAAIVACTELGLRQHAKNYYRSLGYKWYHVPPDFVFTHPLFFFSKHFWRTTFLVPYYKPKVDFNKVDVRQLPLRNQRNEFGKAA